MVIIVVGFGGTAPWYLQCGSDSLEAPSARETVQQTALRQGARRPEQDAGWCSAGRQGTAGEGMAWGAGQMDGCS